MNQQNALTRVAVYGSLKQGFGNHRLLSDSLLLGVGDTPPDYSMLSFGSYPGVIEGSDQIKVEVYAVDDKTLNRLDNLEGHPTFYRREPTAICLEDTEEVTMAWMYTLCHLGEKYASYSRYTVKDEKNRLEWFESQKYRR